MVKAGRMLFVFGRAGFLDFFPNPFMGALDPKCT